MGKRKVWLIALLMVGLAACGGASKKAGPTPSATGSTQASASARPVTFQQGGVLVSETFVDNHQNWSVTQNADSQLQIVKYADGHSEYALSILTNSIVLHPHPELRGLTPAQIDNSMVEASFANNLYVSSKDDFGVTCRDLNGSFYELGVQHTVDGSNWFIAKLVTNAQGSLDSQTLASGTAPTKSTRVVGACVGGSTSGPAHLGISLGATLVGQVDDPQPLKEGYSGVFAHTSSTDVKGNQPPVFSVMEWDLYSATATVG